MAITPFGFDEVKRILELSEKTGGHAGKRHVTISNAGLGERMRLDGAPVANIAMFTAFLTFRDQIEAAVQILNAPQSQPPLEKFYRERQKACELPNIVLTKSIPVRLATAGGGAMIQASFGTIYIRRDGTRPRSLHVITVFARPAVLGHDDERLRRAGL